MVAYKRSIHYICDSIVDVANLLTFEPLPSIKKIIIECRSSAEYPTYEVVCLFHDE